MFKSFNQFLIESEPIKPVSAGRKIPKKLPPKESQSKSGKNPRNSTESTPENPKDTVELRRNLGFKPYGRGKP